jgi:hypothetical protein
MLLWQNSNRYNAFEIINLKLCTITSYIFHIILSDTAFLWTPQSSTQIQSYSFTPDTCTITDENETALKIHSLRCTAFNFVKIPNLFELPNHQTKEMMIHQ